MGLFSARACQSWRYQGAPGHESHANPKHCRKCWIPCGNVLTRDEWNDGVRRCEECVHALVHCPIPRVRMVLVNEDKLSDDILMVLTTDTNATIAAKARRRLSNNAAARAALHADSSAIIPLPSPRRQHRRALESAAAIPAPARESVWSS